MLNRNVDIFHNLWLRCHCVEQLVGNSFGIGVENSYPFDAVDFAKFIQQLREHQFAVNILAVACGVLSDNHQFTNSASSQAVGFVEHTFHCA